MCTQRSGIVAVVLFLVPTLGLGDAPCRATKFSGPTGTLRIDGQGVRSLKLIDGRGRTHSVEVVDGIAKLDPSTYTVREIHLTNGLYCRVTRILSVEVTEDAETVLKAGGPLTQKIEATRSGGMLVMSCFAEGIEGDRYAGRPTGAAPHKCAVYKGRRKIKEGEFEYG